MTDQTTQKQVILDEGCELDIWSYETFVYDSICSLSQKICNVRLRFELENEEVFPDVDEIEEWTRARCAGGNVTAEELCIEAANRFNMSVFCRMESQFHGPIECGRTV